MITIISSDNVSFSVYGRALVKDSRTFAAQIKYQPLNDTRLAEFPAVIVSFYVDFINEGEVVLDKKYGRRVTELAIYLKSNKFLHEAMWQFTYKEYMRTFLLHDSFELADHSAFFKIFSGAYVESEYSDEVIFTHVKQNCMEDMLKTISVYILSMKLNHRVDVMNDMSESIKPLVLYKLFKGTEFSEHWNWAQGLWRAFSYTLMVNVDLFQAAYGTIRELAILAQKCAEEDETEGNDLCTQKLVNMLKEKGNAYCESH